MDTIDQQRQTDLAYLMSEIIASADAYDRLASADNYPAGNLFFRQHQQQRTRFAHLLAHEYHVIHRESWSNYPVAEHAYIHFPPALEDGSLDPLEMEAWVIEREQELVLSYQRVLTTAGLPSVTYALLESQAEDINNTLLKLRVDLKIHSRAVSPS
jgi:hypothetical protein